MTVQEAEEWFENLNKCCLALDIRPQNMTKWKKNGYIPWKQQFKIAHITNWELLPDEQDPYLVRNPRKPLKPKQPRKRTAK